MLRAIRRVLPSSSILWVAAVAYCTTKSFEWLIRLRYGIDPNALEPVEGKPGIQVSAVTLIVLGVTALARGWGRAGQFHPASSDSYAAFLRTTPWSASKRLP